MKKQKDPNHPTPKQPVSEARRAASRANGAKSHGPVTPEGKERSSKNAVTHGILARSLTLSDGDAKLFESLHNNYIQRFTPRDQPEHDLIEEAAYAKWQMRQAWMMHARTLKIQIIADIPNVNAEWDAIPMLDRQTLALAKSLKESTVLPNLERYARQLASQADRAIKLFMQLRDQRRPPTEPVVEPNEPEVMAEHYKSEPSQPAPATDHRLLTTAQPNEPEPVSDPRQTESGDSVGGLTALELITPEPLEPGRLGSLRRPRPDPVGVLKLTQQAVPPPDSGAARIPGEGDPS